MFSIFDAVYEFVRREPADKVQRLPHKVQMEITVAIWLMPLLGADLGRSFLPKLLACDASTVFGFGVSYMPCSTSLVKEVSLLSERRGDFVRFFPDDDAPQKDRLGVPHQLPFHKWQFRTAISAKAQHKAHSGNLEAHGLHTTLKWVLRKPANFHRRLVVLTDAKAVLGAATKGRTSASRVRGILRKIGSLLLATNSLLKLVYVPSEDNPADSPSRGIRQSQIAILQVLGQVREEPAQVDSEYEAFDQSIRRSRGTLHWCAVSSVLFARPRFHSAAEHRELCEGGSSLLVPLSTGCGLSWILCLAV